MSRDVESPETNSRDIVDSTTSPGNLNLDSVVIDESINVTNTNTSKQKPRYKCIDYPPCNLSFTRSEHLIRHTRKHTGERPFQCHCGRRFSRLGNLRHHVQTIHVDEKIPSKSFTTFGTSTRFQRQVRTDRQSGLLQNAYVTTNSPSHKKLRRARMDLPMVLYNAQLSTATVNSTPDTGSEHNIISADLARTLGLIVAGIHQMEFNLANGKIVKSLGKVTTSCSFEQDPSVKLVCSFYVFQTLITPLIMGMEFLDSTETLTKNKHRLRERTSLSNSAFQVSSISVPKRLLHCFAAQESTLAIADTGSDVDLVSLEYVTRRGFKTYELDSDECFIQIADGSIVSLHSKLKISIILRYGGPSFVQSFYVLDGLTSDMLFGDEFLYETDAFETYRESFGVNIADDHLASVNTIVWLKSTERFFSRARKSPTTSTSEFERSNSSDNVRRLTNADRIDGITTAMLRRLRRTQEPAMEVIIDPQTHTVPSRLGQTDVPSSSSSSNSEQEGYEMRRRYLAKQYIRSLDEADRLAAELEESKRVWQYERDKEIESEFLFNDRRRLKDQASNPLTSLRSLEDLKEVPVSRS